MKDIVVTNLCGTEITMYFPQQNKDFTIINSEVVIFKFVYCLFRNSFLFMVVCTLNLGKL